MPRVTRSRTTHERRRTPCTCPIRCPPKQGVRGRPVPAPAESDRFRQINPLAAAARGAAEQFDLPCIPTVNCGGIDGVEKLPGNCHRRSKVPDRHIKLVAYVHCL